MNREIKFRVWDKINGQMYYEVLPGNILSALHGSGDELTEAEKFRYVLQQFTGLKDKNGIEIYEGDIYNLEGWDGNPYYCVWYDGVYWNKRCGQSQKDFLNRHVNVDGDMQHTFRDHYKYITVIGNISENPELYNI